MELPMSIAELLQEILGAKRIGLFLKTRDTDLLRETTTGEALPAISSEREILMKADLTWDVPLATANGSRSPLQQTFELRGLDISFLRGKVTLIAGKFGSGKTLLLLGLLGEARLLKGDISNAVSPLLDAHGLRSSTTTTGSGVAYVPQTAWLQSLSIR